MNAGCSPRLHAFESFADQRPDPRLVEAAARLLEQSGSAGPGLFDAPESLESLDREKAALEGEAPLGEARGVAAELIEGAARVGVEHRAGSLEHRGFAGERVERWRFWRYGLRERWRRCGHIDLCGRTS